MNFTQQIIEILQNSSSPVAIHSFGNSGARACSGQELLELVQRAYGYLQAVGIKAGDRVILLGANSLQWIAADIALQLSQAISVPVYTRESLEGLEYLLSDAEPQLVLHELGGDHPLYKGIQGVSCQVATLDDLLGAEPQQLPSNEPKPEDPVTIIYTSGTSSQPKGVLLNYANLDFMLKETVGWKRLLNGAPERIFHFIPFNFAASRIVLWTCLLQESQLYLCGNLANLADEMRQADPSLVFMVPLVLERVRSAVEKRLKDRGRLLWGMFQGAVRAHGGASSLWDRACLVLARRLLFAPIRKKIAPNLQTIISGSALLQEKTHEFFRMLGYSVVQVYGLTETTAIVTRDRREKIRPGWVGMPIPGCEVKISDEGELLCRGPNIFSAYWRKPEETENALRGGWLLTGDRVEQDGEGRLRILGRMKNTLILSSGHNVQAEAVEEQLCRACPEINQLVVLGHGRPYLTAIVVSEHPQDKILQAIQQANQNESHYKRVQRITCVQDPFSDANGMATGNGKLKRNVILEHYSQEVEGLYKPDS